MDIGNILKLFHIIAAFALIGGMMARSVVMARAKSSTTIQQTALFLQLGNFFTTKMVSIGGLATFFLGIITALVQGWPVLGFLQGGKYNWVFASLVLNLLIYVSVFTVSIPRGKAIGEAIGPALGKGEITPELSATINHGALKNSMIFEYISVALIIILMVLKPF
jgi:hypothetical protein